MRNVLKQIRILNYEYNNSNRKLEKRIYPEMMNV